MAPVIAMPAQKIIKIRFIAIRGGFFCFVSAKLSAKCNKFTTQIFHATYFPTSKKMGVHEVYPHFLWIVTYHLSATITFRNVQKLQSILPT